MLGEIVSEPTTVAIAKNLQILKEKERPNLGGQKKLEALSEIVELRIVGTITCASFIYFAISRQQSSVSNNCFNDKSASFKADNKIVLVILHL